MNKIINDDCIEETKWKKYGVLWRKNNPDKVKKYNKKHNSKKQNVYANYWICRKDDIKYLIHLVSKDRLSKIGFDPELCEEINRGYYNIIDENSVKKLNDKKIYNI